jgi:hypothetical protein
MMQFITALEKTAAACNYSKSNRFDSFAPMRLNVAAQWLVDGVHLFSFVLAQWSGLFKNFVDFAFHIARLFLEPFPRHSPRKGEHIHPRLVAFSR